MTCLHGFIGACVECDGCGQTPERPDPRRIKDNEHLFQSYLTKAISAFAYKMGRSVDETDYDTSKIRKDWIAGIAADLCGQRLFLAYKRQYT